MIEATSDQPADDRRRILPLIEDVIADAPFNVLLGECAVDALYDVIALTERPHGRLGGLRQMPLGGTERYREAEALELSHAPDQGQLSGSPRRAPGFGPQIDDAVMLGRLGGKHTVELGPAVCLNLSIQPRADFGTAPRSELERDQVAGTGAQALADVVPRDHKVAAIVRLAADDHMDMWILGIPLVDCDPVKLGPEIPFGVCH